MCVYEMKRAFVVKHTDGAGGKGGKGMKVAAATCAPRRRSATPELNI